MAATVCIVLRTPQPRYVHARMHDARYTMHARTHARMHPSKPDAALAPSCAVYAISRYVSAAIAPRVSVPRETSSNPSASEEEGNIENADP